jgi:hypothetical protein
MMLGVIPEMTGSTHCHQVLRAAVLFDVIKVSHGQTPANWVLSHGQVIVASSVDKFLNRLFGFSALFAAGLTRPTRPLPN